MKSDHQPHTPSPPAAQEGVWDHDSGTYTTPWYDFRPPAPAPDAGREPDIERMAAAVHQAYLDTCARLGWSVKPENQVPYTELTEESKELDRASVRAVLQSAELTDLRADREAQRWCNMQHGPRIPWSIAEQIYSKYRERHPSVNQSLEMIHKRGGFGWAEVESLFDRQDRTFEPIRAAVRAVEARDADREALEAAIHALVSRDVAGYWFVLNDTVDGPTEALLNSALPQPAQEQGIWECNCSVRRCHEDGCHPHWPHDSWCQSLRSIQEQEAGK